MFNLCLCGVQSGYAHKPDCPYPYYGNNPTSIEQWEKERKAKQSDLNNNQK